MYRRYIKRILDVILAVLSFMIAGWLMVIIAIGLIIANKGAGAFFLQERPGKGGKPFRIIKFKTMADRFDADGNPLPDAERLTGIGRIVRSLSIDELPQLVNILKGDMSFIGPRPLLMDYLPLYSAEQMRRHEVRPGISGWAQVNGRNGISFTRQFEQDVYYVDHLTFWLDVKIFFMTILQIFKREGETGREPFNGEN